VYVHSASSQLRARSSAKPVLIDFVTGLQFSAGARERVFQLKILHLFILAQMDIRVNKHYTFCMEKSVFTKIIEGEIPAFKVYEDEKTIAFLDIFPKIRGHTLVVPKVQVDKFYNLTDEDYEALFATVKKLARRMDEVFGTRTLMKVVGTDVPHAHVHLMPYDENYDADREPERASEAELTRVAEMIRF
jgi:histidine triad (HIT) family protein